jgi:hypothetical protein
VQGTSVDQAGYTHRRAGRQHQHEVMQASSCAQPHDLMGHPQPHQPPRSACLQSVCEGHQLHMVALLPHGIHTLRAEGGHI